MKEKNPRPTTKINVFITWRELSSIIIYKIDKLEILQSQKDALKLKLQIITEASSKITGWARAFKVIDDCIAIKNNSEIYIELHYIKISIYSDFIKCTSVNNINTRIYQNSTHFETKINITKKLTMQNATEILEKIMHLVNTRRALITKHLNSVKLNNNPRLKKCDTIKSNKFLKWSEVSALIIDKIKNLNIPAEQKDSLINRVKVITNTAKDIKPRAKQFYLMKNSIKIENNIIYIDLYCVKISIYEDTIECISNKNIDFSSVKPLNKASLNCSAKLTYSACRPLLINLYSFIADKNIYRLTERVSV